MGKLDRKLDFKGIDKLSMHGGREKGLLDFSISVNPYQPDWKRELFSEAEKSSMAYPYLERLDRELSELVGEGAAITAGATEGIYLSAILLKNFGIKRALIPQPTYSEYERVSRIFGFRVVKTIFEPEKIAEKVEKSDAVFFCNPNNPDGRYFSPKELKPIVEAVEDTDSILILDEAFKDFVRDFKSPESESILKLRTFTKSYGMPGIRAGYVVGFVDEIKAIRMPWSIGCVGLVFMERVVDDSFKFLEETMPKIWREKERFERELSVKSDANYFLLKSDPKALRSKGILIRDCSSFGLPGYIRFSVRKPDENSKLIAAINEIEN